MTIIAKGRHVLGKLSRNCDKTAPRNCEAALTYELRENDGKLEFSACGEVWNNLKTDTVWGGQCVDELAALFPRDKLAQRIRETWRHYHLNGMNAGTPEQTAALRQAEESAVKLLRSTNSPAGCFYDSEKTRVNWYVAGDYITGQNGAGYYGWACAALKQAGLYEVPVTDELRAAATGGIPDDWKTYRYGTRWLHFPIPADTVELIKRGFQDADGSPALVADPEEAGEPERNLIEESGLTVAAVFVPWSLSRNAKEKHPSLNWRVTLKCKGRDVLTCDYMAGSGHCPADKKKWNTPHDKREAIRQECETGRTYKRLFGGGVATKGTPIVPDARDVISSLLRDCDALDHASFADWCAEYGYDADSIKDRATYDECVSHAVALRAAVGPGMFEALRAGN